jgi:hypothetical protein
MIFQYNSNENVFGKIYEGPIRNKFTKSQFDRISSSGEWTDKWKDIPKICKLDIGQGHKTDPNKLVIFYLNETGTPISLGGREIVVSIGYLWLNLIGCTLVMIISLILNKILVPASKKL